MRHPPPQAVQVALSRLDAPLDGGLDIRTPLGPASEHFADLIETEVQFPQAPDVPNRLCRPWGIVAACARPARRHGQQAAALVIADGFNPYTGLVGQFADLHGLLDPPAVQGAG
jgi:hypothetical protein